MIFIEIVEIVGGDVRSDDDRDCDIYRDCRR